MMLWKECPESKKATETTTLIQGKRYADCFCGASGLNILAPCDPPAETVDVKAAQCCAGHCQIFKTAAEAAPEDIDPDFMAYMDKVKTNV